VGRKWTWQGISAVLVMVGLCWIGVIRPGQANAANPVGSSFVFRLQNDRMVISLTQRYSPTRSLDQVKAVLGDNDLLPVISDLISAIRTVPNGAHRTLVYSTATKVLDVGMRVEKSVVTVNSCQDQEDRTSWRRSCTLVLDQGDTRKFMAYGRSSISCSEGAAPGGQVTCTIRTEVQPKAINYWPVYSRTPQQLAAAGAQQSMRDFGTLFLIANTNVSPERAKSTFSGSKLDHLGSRLFNDIRAQVDGGKLGSKVLIIKGSDFPESYSTQVVAN